MKIFRVARHLHIFITLVGLGLMHAPAQSDDALYSLSFVLHHQAQQTTEKIPQKPDIQPLKIGTIWTSLAATQKGVQRDALFQKLNNINDQKNPLSKYALYRKDLNALHTQHGELPQKPPKTFRVATYNVQFWSGPTPKSNQVRTYESILEIIGKMNADVLCLQEVSAKKSDSTLTTLKNDLQKYGYRFFQDTKDLMPKTHWYFTNMICSKIKMTASPGKYFKAHAPSKIGEERGFVRGTITIGGKKITIYCTHLDVHDKNEKIRTAEMQELIDDVRALEKKHGDSFFIIAGDFISVRKADYDQIKVNNHETLWDLCLEDDAYRFKKHNQNYQTPTLLEAFFEARKKYWTNVFDAKPERKPAFTSWTEKTIDYIYFSRKKIGGSALHVMGAYPFYHTAERFIDGKIEFFGSDHVPLVADFGIR